MKKAELQFRHDLAGAMRPHWNMTWHEDKGISPGVPDLHYGFPPEPDVRSARYQIGWLELKATDKPLSKSNRIKVEPSQHSYIRKWNGITIIHFLIRVETMVFLIPGGYSAMIPLCESAESFTLMNSHWFDQIDMSFTLPNILKEITRI